MRPVFRIEAGDTDITGRLSGRLLQLQVHMFDEGQSDWLLVTLDDRDHELPVLPPRSPLQIWLGYDSPDHYMGKYLRADVHFNTPPATLSIRASAADFQETLKSFHTRSWENVTLGDLVRTIATEHGYTGVCAPALAGIVLPHIDQSAESDLHLLRRIGRKYNGRLKFAAGRLIMSRAGSGRSAGTDIPLPAVVLRPGDISEVRVVHHDRPAYDTVAVRYPDQAAGGMKVAEAGSGPKRYEFRHPGANIDEARSIAASELSRLNRIKADLYLGLPGRPEILTETPLTLEGYREGINGDWIVSHVSHIYSKQQGLISTLTARLRLLSDDVSAAEDIR